MAVIFIKIQFKNTAMQTQKLDGKQFTGKILFQNNNNFLFDCKVQFLNRKDGRRRKKNTCVFSNWQSLILNNHRAIYNKNVKFSLYASNINVAHRACCFHTVKRENIKWDSCKNCLPFSTIGSCVSPHTLFEQNS